jgi:hypothetical protein
MIWSNVLGMQIHYPGENLDAFEAKMREFAPSWAAFDIRMMFQGYLERGFTAEQGDRNVDRVAGARPGDRKSLRGKPRRAGGNRGIRS